MNKNIIFLIKFAVIFTILTALIEIIDLTLVQNFITQLSANFLGLNFSGINIFVKEGVFAITKLCTGLLSIAILASIIFSLSKPELNKKLVIFFAGGIGLFLLNIIRVIFVLEIGKGFGVKIAELFHIISWFSTAALIIIAWYFATKKIAKVENFQELL
ncbi:MAG: archaeosortase/exosortase family protein [archaeon]|nr:archaeosortase/exosortase family protein [archaeon]